jgi:hypothetical protein
VKARPETGMRVRTPGGRLDDAVAVLDGLAEADGRALPTEAVASKGRWLALLI